MSFVKLCFFSFLFLCLGVSSAQGKGQKKKTKRPPVIQKPTTETTFEKFHNRVSNRILRFANRIDNIFANEKALQERNGTYILVDQFGIYDYGLSYDFSMRVNFSMPGTEERVNLFIEDQKQNVIQAAGFDGSSTLAEDDETRVGARIGLLGGFEEAFSITTRAGVKSLGLTWEEIDPFLDIRFRYTHTFTENFLFEGHITPGYSVADRREVVTGAKFDYTPYKRWLFRAANNSRWDDDQYRTIWLNGVSIFYNIFEERVISTSFGVESNDGGGPHIASYLASLGYQQNIKWKWLQLQAVNYWDWERTNRFYRHSRFELLLRLRFGAF